MPEAIPAFETLVLSVDDSTAFKTESINFYQKTCAASASPEAMDFFRSTMLASLRSLLPVVWTLQHELAWTWFWESSKAHRDSTTDESWLMSMLSCKPASDAKEVYESR